MRYSPIVVHVVFSLLHNYQVDLHKELTVWSLLLRCYFASVSVQSIVISRFVSVCLFVCLSARVSQRPQTCGRGSVLAWRLCDTLCTPEFVDDVMVSYNVGKRPESKIKDDAYVSFSSPGGGTSRTLDNVVWLRSPGGGTGAKSAVPTVCHTPVLYQNG